MLIRRRASSETTRIARPSICVAPQLASPPTGKLAAGFGRSVLRQQLEWLSLACVLGLSVDLNAQGLGPRPGGFGPGGGGAQPTQPDKPAGPAEAAPEAEDSDEPELPPMPGWPGQQTRKLQFFELNGYLRFRADMLHNFNLGQPEFDNLKAPFYVPLSESPGSSQRCDDRRQNAVPGGSDRGLDGNDCPGNTLGGANLRLRLEPTINVSEAVRVYAQIDVFDNIILGSTPNGTFADASTSDAHPLSILDDTQGPPIAGQNTKTPAILVKRAWGEVTTPLGILRFGRMPWHWGLGLLANDGGCWDCNFGDNIDRIMFATDLANHVIGMGYDFASSGPTSLSLSGRGTNYDATVVDIEQLDDVDQLFWVVGRIDKPSVLRDRVEQGELVFNYGLYLLWRKQDFDTSEGFVGDEEDAPSPAETADDFSGRIVERHAWMLIPDIWFKLLYKKLSLEFEGILVGGKIENAGPSDTPQPVSLLQFGWVLRSQYKMLRDALKVGLEIGMASGDSAEPRNSDYNRRRRASPLRDASTNDDDYNEFRFDFDYLVDLILFRELIGTVANAVYFKPWIQYDLLSSLGARLDVIYSLAHRPVAFPGNSPNLGLEFDLDLYYRNEAEGFYAGFQYGILIPFAGLDRPESIYGVLRARNASVAQTLQARLIIKF